MDPSSRHHRADTLRDHGRFVEFSPKFVVDVADKFVEILDECSHGGRRALLAAGAAVRPRIPSEKRYLGQIQFIHQMSHAAGVFVAAMQQDDGPISSPAPMAKKDIHPSRVLKKRSSATRVPEVPPAATTAGSMPSIIRSGGPVG